MNKNILEQIPSLNSKISIIKDMPKSTSILSTSSVKMEANKLHKLLTKEKISIKLSLIPKSKTKSSHSPILASRNGDFKKILLLFNMNLPKSSSLKNYISIQTTNHMLSLQKRIIFYVGKNLRNAQYTISPLNKLKESLR